VKFDDAEALVYHDLDDLPERFEQPNPSVLPVAFRQEDDDHPNHLLRDLSSLPDQPDQPD